MRTPRNAGLARAGGARAGAWTRALGLAVVRGRSMEPTLREGDRLLVRYDAVPDVGGLVLARFADGTLAVKRATGRRALRTGEPGWWLLSDNPGEGVDSRHRGPVGDADVRAVVLARVWPSPRLGRHLTHP